MVLVWHIFVNAQQQQFIFDKKLVLKILQNSTAAIDSSNDIESTENRYVSITANIRNATNLTTRVRVKGFGGLNSNGFDSLASILHRKSFRPRSVVALCAEDSSNQIQRHKRIVEYGRRQWNDAIVRFQREIVFAVDTQNYPNFTFSFSDRNVSITYVALTMNVCIPFRVYILNGPMNNSWIFYSLTLSFSVNCVVVREQTPGAIVFSNKVLFNEHEFRATVYELNKEMFSTDLVVYGHRF